MNNAANWNSRAGDQSLLRIGRNGAEAGLGDDRQNDCASPPRERRPNLLILDGSERYPHAPLAGEYQFRAERITGPSLEEKVMAAFRAKSGYRDVIFDVIRLGQHRIFRLLE